MEGGKRGRMKGGGEKGVKVMTSCLCSMNIVYANPLSNQRLYFMVLNRIPTGCTSMSYISGTHDPPLLDWHLPSLFNQAIWLLAITQ